MNTKYEKPVWICHTFNRLGKKHCASKQIPESILMEVTASVMGSQQFSPEQLHSMIERIDVTGHNSLLFVFKDGRSVPADWQDHSRKDSWDDEAKEIARQRQNELVMRRKSDAK